MDRQVEAHRIHRLRIHDAPADTLEVRLTIEHLIAEALVMPAWLPPRAILLVPTLAPEDPLPLHDERGIAQWVHHLRQHLETLATQAIIPTRGEIPPDAPALLLRDEAEWLALRLLVSAALETAPPHFPPLANAARTSPTTLLHQAPHLAPAAWQILRHWGREEALLERLSLPEIRKVVHRIAATWQIPFPRTMSAGFPPRLLMRHLCHHLATNPAQASAHLVRMIDQPPSSTPGEADTDDATKDHRTMKHTEPRGESVDAPRLTPRPDGNMTKEELEQPTHTSSPSPATHAPFTPLLASTSPSAWAHVIQTHLGGLLYLLNLCRWLDIPHSLSAHWPEATELSLWAWVELLGRALLDPLDIPEDPIWHWLATMDGREPATLPGADLPPLEHFHLPPDWLIDGPSSLHWMIEQTHLHLFDTQGRRFVVLPCEATPPAIQAARLARRYGARPQRGRSVPPTFEAEHDWWRTLNEGVRTWLRYAMPTIRHIWNAQTKGTPPARILRSRESAEIQTTTTHVDVIWPLEAISLPARLAGLDASLGWIPAVGRVVTFEFR